MSVVSTIGSIVRFPFSSKTRFLLTGVTLYAAFAARKVFSDIRASAQYDATRSSRREPLVASDERLQHEGEQKKLQEIFQERVEARKASDSSPSVEASVEAAAEVVSAPAESAVPGAATEVKGAEKPSNWLELADASPEAYLEWTGFLHRVFAGSYVDQHPFTSDMEFRDEVKERILDICNVLVFRYYKPGWIMGERRQKAFFKRVEKRIEKVFSEVLPLFDNLPTPEHSDLPLGVQRDISPLLKGKKPLTRRAVVAFFETARKGEAGRGDDLPKEPKKLALRGVIVSTDTEDCQIDPSLADWMFGRAVKAGSNPYAKSAQRSRKLRDRDPVINWIRLFLDGRVDDHPWLEELKKKKVEAHKAEASAKEAEAEEDAIAVEREEEFELEAELKSGALVEGDDGGEDINEAKLKKWVSRALNHKTAMFKLVKFVMKRIAPMLVRKDIQKANMDEADREFQLSLIKHAFPLWLDLISLVEDNRNSELFEALWQRIPRLAFNLGRPADSFQGILDAIELGRKDTNSPPMVLARLMFWANEENFSKPVPGLREVLEGKIDEGRKIYTLHLLDSFRDRLTKELNSET